MSSSFVRDAFELSWTSLMPTLTLVDSINIEPDRATLPDTWATLDYIPINENTISIGTRKCVRERGTIVPVVFVAAGSASKAALLLADNIRDQFRDWKDPSGNITITEASPGETGEGSSGLWFAVSVNLHYQYDRFI